MRYTFKIPVVTPLKSDQNIDAWKEAIQSCFLIHGLSKFLTNDDGAPADEAPQATKDEYTRNKAISHAIIRQSVKPVMDVIKHFGWTDGTDDPKGLYDMAIRAFDNLQAFNTRYHFLMTKLEAAGVSYNDKAKLANLMKALRKWDQHWADMLSFQVNTGKLTYNELVLLISMRANEQSMHNMATVTTNSNKKNAKPANSNNNGNGSAPTASSRPNCFTIAASVTIPTVMRVAG
ncbi:hypothetical protein C8A05DRAFT_30415 [Staphylotrichum tortipilum]|uniref:Gag protein n=1 Tax=Staphylotrichum tortipilum TaxID=2831512 RepID=A0AAN6MRY1_9PEZI|nr:hypothetical protein C8A05DRAFT_30415 [Staphylotrichum longicolle]